MEIESRFWITKDGQKVFGKGPCILLKTVERLGSLNKAAGELNISYSKAWSIIHNAENLLGHKLLETNTGGQNGGGSNLTSKAKALIKAYEGFCQNIEKSIKELYNEYFESALYE